MLAALHQELVSNRIAIEAQMAEIMEGQRRHRALLAMTPSDLAALPRDSLGPHIRVPLLRAYTVELADGEFNAAVGSGRLSLIRNPEIRSGLGAYQAKRRDVDEIGVAVFELTVQARLALARLPGLATWVGNGNPTTRSAIDTESFARIPWDTELMAIAAAKADLYTPFLNQLGQLHDELDRVITHLEAELDIPTGQ